jgi:hypothetical protein
MTLIQQMKKNKKKNNRVVWTLCLSFFLSLSLSLYSMSARILFVRPSLALYA